MTLTRASWFAIIIHPRSATKLVHQIIQRIIDDLDLAAIDFVDILLTDRFHTRNFLRHGCGEVVQLLIIVFDVKELKLARDQVLHQTIVANDD